MKLCEKRDPLLQLIEDELNANLIRVPRASLQPFTVLSKQGKRVQPYAKLQMLLREENTPFSLSAQQLVPSPVAALSGKETVEIEAQMGLEMLQGFLKGFLQGLGVSVPSFTASLKSARTLTYAFEEVFEIGIGNGKLGTALTGRVIDRENVATARFFGEDRAAFLLIDRVFVSKRFYLNVARHVATDIGGEIEALADSVGKVDARFKAKKISETTVAFEGENPLPFAFTCVHLRLNEEGKVVKIDPREPGEFGPKGHEYKEPYALFQPIRLTEASEMLEFDD